MTATLVLLRHGESDWNLKNLFTGWVDVDLTEAGEAQARRGGELLAEHGLLPKVVHTSLLRRAIRTAELALNAADLHWMPVRRSWRLNERHYGALQGKDKAAVRAEFGDEQFMLWRRSYDVPPPPLADDDEYSQVGDPRYADLLDSVPRTECLADVVARMLPYFYDAIVPDLRNGTVLVVAHGNSLRALIKHLDGLSDEAVVSLNVPTGIPLRYELDAATLLPVRPAEYLDPEAAGVAIEEVANQGKKYAVTAVPAAVVAIPDGRDSGQDGGGCLTAAEPAGICTGGDEHDPAGHPDRVVGVALVVAAEQRHVDRGLGAVRPVVRQQLGEQLAVQGVHRVVLGLDRLGQLDVAALDHLGDLVHQRQRDLAHLARSRRAAPAAPRCPGSASGPPWPRAAPGHPSAPGRPPGAAW